MLGREETSLVIIDVQGKLARTVYEAEYILANQQKLAKGARVFELPVALTEQNPAGLGPTVPEMRELLGDLPAVEKTSFNSCLNPAFVSELRNTGRNCVLVCGIEAHVCVFQTVAGLLDLSFEVYVAADAVSSRTSWNRSIALDRMRHMGAVVTSTEMALFELMETAEGDIFREFIRIVK